MLVLPSIQQFINLFSGNNTITEVNQYITNTKEEFNMSNRSNRVLVPEAKEGLNRFKMEAAKEVGVNLKEGYNGDLTSRENGSVGGQMVKRMVESYEKGL
jgi:hypothetical protein